MKILFYTERVPRETVKGNPCCRGMEAAWKDGSVRANHKCGIISGGLTHADTYITHCPWCGARIEIEVDLP